MVAGEVVAATAKMGLNPETSRGLVLLTDAELLAAAAVAVTGLEAAVAEGLLNWVARPNRPAAGGMLLEGLET